jgi:hypothetical protein
VPTHVGIFINGNKNKLGCEYCDQSMKLQKMVTMDIIARPFNKHSKWRVFEDIRHVLVDIEDNLDLNDRIFRALCAHLLLVPHDVLTKLVLRFPLV